MKRHQIFKTIIDGLFLLLLLITVGCFRTQSVRAANAYDLSEWQGRITTPQARHLKHEVNFVIMRAQNGSRLDNRYLQNSAAMRRAHVPYGAYSYSLYRNPASARSEANSLYRYAPHAKFYVNDIETNRPRLSSSTAAWAKQMKRLTTRPVVLYSYANFIGSHLRRVLNRYNAVWVASYSRYRPATRYHYDLWQFTNSYHSRALHKRVDASVLTGNRPLSFWTGGDNRSANSGNQVVQIISDMTAHQHSARHHHHHRHFRTTFRRFKRHYLHLRKAYYRNRSQLTL